MRAGRYLISLFFLFFSVDISQAYNPGLLLKDPYFLKSGGVYLSLDGDSIGLRNGLLFFYTLSVDYGINENVLLSANLPYLNLNGADDGGCFGDVTTEVKLDLAHSETLTWRVLTDFLFQFPTGIIPENAVRIVNGTNLTYYPFSRGAPLFSPSVISSFILDNFVVNGTISYYSEGLPGENVFTINPSSDRIGFQISGDYVFKTVFFQTTLLIRPSICVDYQYNISPQRISPDGFSSILECNARLVPDWKAVFRWIIPFYEKSSYYITDISLELGRYF